ncbi:MAG TPA: dihydropteroate synthase [Candidatus Eisenbacteria bacterium]|nr:dihydropteroate synthase [Candidatus Eisenbacteria bacterium]
METDIAGTRFRWGVRVYVMGIVNVTPDSFSGDGVVEPEAAARQALRMIDEGADLVDVGGESTRPGHEPVTAEEELRRVLPVLRRLRSAAAVPISIDTWKLEVAEAAVAEGATILNDIWGLQRAPGLAALAAQRGLGLVLMHNQRGTAYAGDLLAEIAASLRRSLSAALAAGVPRERIVLDPGIGFGKTAAQGVEVLRRFGELTELGQPLLVGVSRKSFLERVFGQPLGERLPGTIASVTAAVLRGADVVRVHDVAEVARAVRVAEALR